MESTGFVIKFDQRVFLVTCLHSFFEYDELKDDADKVLLPNGYDIAEHIKSRILDTYSFQFHSAANLKRGRDILLKGYGVPNVFVDMVSMMTHEAMQFSFLSTLIIMLSFMIL